METKFATGKKNYFHLLLTNVVDIKESWLNTFLKYVLNFIHSVLLAPSMCCYYLGRYQISDESSPLGGASNSFSQKRGPYIFVFIKLGSNTSSKYVEL